MTAETKPVQPGTHTVMLCVPVVTLSDSTLVGKPGDVIAGVHWAEAMSAAHRGDVVIVDDLDDFGGLLK